MAQIRRKLTPRIIIQLVLFLSLFVLNFVLFFNLYDKVQKLLFFEPGDILIFNLNEGASHGLLLILLAICIPGIILSFIYTDEPSNMRNRKITIAASVVLLMFLFFPLNNYAIFSDQSFLISNFKLQKRVYEYSDISKISIYPTEKYVINEDSTKHTFLIPEVDMYLNEGEIISFSRLDDFKMRQLVNYDDLKEMLTILNYRGVLIELSDIEEYQKAEDYKESRSYKETNDFYDFVKKLK